MNENAFLAIDLSNEERHLLSAALTEASPGAPIPGRRAPSKNWHLTLRFLGECSDAQTDRIMHSLAESIEGGSGRVWCDGLGAFPAASKASVVYCAIDDPIGILGYLAAVCEEAALDAGFEPEGRPYLAHLTLSRLRPALDVRPLFSSYGEFRSPIAVRAVTLFRTHSASPRPTYESIDTLALL